VYIESYSSLLPFSSSLFSLVSSISAIYKAPFYTCIAGLFNGSQLELAGIGILVDAKALRIRLVRIVVYKTGCLKLFNKPCFIL
jgi:hypothetical protein